MQSRGNVVARFATAETVKIDNAYWYLEYKFKYKIDFLGIQILLQVLKLTRLPQTMCKSVNPKM